MDDRAAMDAPPAPTQRPLLLAALARPFILLEDRLVPKIEARLYAAPVEVIRCDDPAAIEAAFARLETGLRAGWHAAGYCAYELGRALEPGPRSPEAARSPPRPLLWFGLFPPPILVPPAEADAAFAALGPPPPLYDLAFGHDRATHVDKVRRVLSLIAAGDIYQANLTFPVRFRYGGDPLRLYAALRARQPVAHGALMALEDRVIASVSPELFFEVRAGIATARPMKGTAARQADPEDDRRARDALAADPKQRAENLMIVDLIRNDLARIGEPGSVKTSAVFAVETYPTFHTLTSTISAKLRPGVGLQERFAALFPCGSIVGAPKIRAAQILHGLEGQNRDIYTGATGAIAPDGDMAFNVAIRTAVIGADGVGVYGVGGGIVADSDPHAEYDEALLKARTLTDLAADYGLIETFRWSRRLGFIRLRDHLARLAASAERLSFPFSDVQARQRLEAAVPAWRDDAADRRVRLLLSRQGELTLTAEPIASLAQPARPVRLLVSTIRLDEGDPFLRHKTTVRGVYEAAHREAVAAQADEAILLGRARAIADGSRNSLFVQRDGRLWTPAVEAGALPGVLRGRLIASGVARVGALTPADLTRADRLLVGNSLHSLRPAILA